MQSQPWQAQNHQQRSDMEGAARKRKERSGSQTWSLHFLLRCCAPTASKSASLEAGESPNAQKSENLTHWKFAHVIFYSQHFDYILNKWWQFLEALLNCCIWRIGNFLKRSKSKLWTMMKWWNHVKMKNSRFCPKGRPEWRKSGEFFAPLTIVDWRPKIEDRWLSSFFLCQTALRARISSYVFALSNANSKNLSLRFWGNSQLSF